jgi:hypothetical protein
MELRREEAASFKMEDYAMLVVEVTCPLLSRLITCSGVIPVTVNGSKLAKQLLMKATVVKKMRRVCMINKILCFGK